VLNFHFWNRLGVTEIIWFAIATGIAEGLSYYIHPHAQGRVEIVEMIDPSWNLYELEIGGIMSSILEK
jgi:hypothetical protein